RTRPRGDVRAADHACLGARGATARAADGPGPDASVHAARIRRRLTPLSIPRRVVGQFVGAAAARDHRATGAASLFATYAGSVKSELTLTLPTSGRSVTS